MLPISPILKVSGAIVYMYHDIDAYKINTFSSEDMHGDMCHGIDIMFDILHK